jgi:hypothetical protein
VVVALGRAGLKLALELEAVEVVGACIISPVEGDQRAAALQSLSPDPALLLQRLRSLQPAVRRVSVVHSVRHSAWLIRLAQDAARGMGIELRALEAEDLKTALRHYQDFFAEAGVQDALWLLQDPSTVDDATVLPLVLQQSWTRQVTLFSSNLAHVRRGAHCSASTPTTSTSVAASVRPRSGLLGPSGRRGARTATAAQRPGGAQHAHRQPPGSGPQPIAAARLRAAAARAMKAPLRSWLRPLWRSTFRRQLSVAVGVGVLLMGALSAWISSWQAGLQAREALLQQGLTLAASMAQQSRLAC